MASIANNFEINVAKKRKPDDEYGIHFCKIQLPENTHEAKAKEKFQFFRELFGKEYNLTMTYWKCYGERKDEWN